MPFSFTPYTTRFSRLSTITTLNNAQTTLHTAIPRHLPPLLHQRIYNPITLFRISSDRRRSITTIEWPPTTSKLTMYVRFHPYLLSHLLPLSHPTNIPPVTVQDGSTVNCIFLTLTNYVYPMQSVPATCSSTSGDVWKWYLTSYTNAGQFTLYISHTNGGVVHQSTGIISYADTQARGATYSCDAAGSCTYEFDNAGDPIRIGFS